ncbi:unnamed protein product [Litomosoides sigmodontis]|uniref:SHSP domain-containing protein n=1 Tax=Litomosoides sigmodontis TaxID=42156 RepID=A0A3P6TKZ6_LITSI|nr:unnamed protein product [Litomosoides sigmodontis]
MSHTVRETSTALAGLYIWQEGSRVRASAYLFNGFWVTIAASCLNFKFPIIRTLAVQHRCVVLEIFSSGCACYSVIRSTRLMLRLLNREVIRRGVSALTNGSRILSTRNYSFGSRYPLSAVFRSIDRQLQEIEQQFDRAFWNSRYWFNNFRPIRVYEHPSQTEAYRVRNPIVEEDGVQKFLLELDVRRFKPEEVIVKTNAKENTLTVEAKHKDDETRFEYLRKITLPQGVVSKDMTCHFTSDGILQIKAPYNAPQEAIAADTEIPVKHE